LIEAGGHDDRDDDDLETLLGYPGSNGSAFTISLGVFHFPAFCEDQGDIAAERIW
jgi:hypothetical protein